MPHATEHVEAVSLGLARGVIDGIAVQRVPVVGGLGGAIGAGDGAELATHALPGLHGPGYRGPDLSAGPPAFRRGGRVRGERVQGERPAIGDHGHAADCRGLQRGAPLPALVLEGELEHAAALTATAATPAAASNLIRIDVSLAPFPVPTVK